MSYIAKELRAKRAEMISAARALVDSPNASAEDNAKFDELMAQAEVVKSEFERIERAASMEAELNTAREIKAETRKVSVAQVEDEAAREDRVLHAYLRHGLANLSAADRDFASARFNAAQGTGTGGAGGFTVAPDTSFMNKLDQKLLAFGGMRQVARVIKTETGANLPIPTMDDTSNVGEIISEGATQNQQDVVFSQVSLGSFTYSSKMILVPIQLIQDSAVDVPDLLTGALATRIGRIQNTHYTVGTGTGQPLGIVPAAASGKVGVTGQATSVTYADLVALIHSVDVAYRDANCQFMFHDSTLAALKRMVDAQGRPLWVPGLSVGEPDRLLGYKYTINNDVAPMASNARSVIFGALSNYWIRDVLGLTIRRLDERYAETLSVAFFAAQRSSGALISAGQPVRYYQNSAT